jgi:hypothetical protein
MNEMLTVFDTLCQAVMCFCFAGAGLLTLAMLRLTFEKN